MTYKKRAAICFFCMVVIGGIGQGLYAMKMWSPKMPGFLIMAATPFLLAALIFSFISVGREDERSGASYFSLVVCLAMSVLAGAFYKGLYNIYQKGKRQEARGETKPPPDDNQIASRKAGKAFTEAMDKKLTELVATDEERKKVEFSIVEALKTPIQAAMRLGKAKEKYLERSKTVATPVRNKTAYAELLAAAEEYETEVADYAQASRQVPIYLQRNLEKLNVVGKLQEGVMEVFNTEQGKTKSLTDELKACEQEQVDTVQRLNKRLHAEWEHWVIESNKVIFAKKELADAHEKDLKAIEDLETRYVRARKALTLDR